ncbi:MAG: class I SAM-dependent methyltransferase [Pyrinomonadaceae bacterium MAG19_C2-C3]|nr:class I SAM-dependent methyltransferase [Pyrinomonadaceae bacterium MAG19_C2-C3]
MIDSKERFSTRVANYIKHRPDYPRELVAFLRDELALNSSSIVADIGAGTGILTRAFLENGNRVFAVEPNDEMRRAAEEVLAKYDGFHSIKGSAEATTLERESVDYIVAGQAFHWFDVERARVELTRILKPDGWAVMVWNYLLTDKTEFLREYDELLIEYGVDYLQVRKSWDDAASLMKFYGAGNYRLETLDNRQILNYEGLRGRLLSSSFAPQAGEAKHDEMMRRLDEIYARHAVDNRVEMIYETRMYYGRLKHVGGVD